MLENFIYIILSFWCNYLTRANIFVYVYVCLICICIGGPFPHPGCNCMDLWEKKMMMMIIYLLTTLNLGSIWSIL
jgi:hypothetical protein